MKKTIIKATAIIATIAALSAGAYTLGHREGVRHAIEDSEVWLPEGYTTEEVEYWVELDTDNELWLDDIQLPIEICLDGNLYTHAATLS